MSEAIGAALVGPMVGDKHRVGPDRFHNVGLYGDLVATCFYRYPVVGLDAVLFREARVDLNQGLRVDIDQCADSPRLGAG